MAAKQDGGATTAAARAKALAAADQREERLEWYVATQQNTAVADEDEQDTRGSLKYDAHEEDGGVGDYELRKFKFPDVLARVYPQGHAYWSQAREAMRTFLVGLSVADADTAIRRFDRHTIFDLHLMGELYKLLVFSDTRAVLERAREMYRYGFNPPEVVDEALRLLEIVAAAGTEPHNAEAGYYVGIAMVFGDGTRPHAPKEGRLRFAVSAQLGHVPSAYYHARCVAFAHDDASLYEGAVALLEAEVAKPDPDPECLYLLGRILAYGEDGREVEVERGLELWLQAAKSNHILAAMRVAECYLYGQGVEPDYREALRLFQHARELGHPEAQEFITQIEDYLRYIEAMAQQLQAAANGNNGNNDNNNDDIGPGDVDING